jgi:hypothetical protein
MRNTTLIGAGPGHAIVANRSLVTIVLRGVFTSEIASACYRAVEDAAAKHAGRACVLVVIEPKAPTPDPPVRAQTAETMRNVADRITGWAVVVEGGGLRPTIVRSVLVAINMMSRSVLDTKYFETVDEAAQWLKSRPRAELDAGEIRQTAEFAREQLVGSRHAEHR